MKKRRIRRKSNFKKVVIIVLLFFAIITSIVFLFKVFASLLKESYTYKKQKDILSEKIDSDTVEEILQSDNKNKDKIVKIVSEKYYKKDNYERYLKYFNENKSLDSKKIVEDVNCNLDIEYYTSDYNADLSKGFLVLVNKYYKLASNYVPEDLIKTEIPYGDGRYINKYVYEAFLKMYDAISKENMNIYIASPYRSYNYQEKLYSNYASKNGVDKADTFSARAGYSEHQTGLAMDISNVKTSYTEFENTDEYKWMLNNAHKYGFILRYPKGKERQTGYVFESWHYRYVGVEVAKYIHENNITFDEYYEYFLK